MSISRKVQRRTRFLYSRFKKLKATKDADQRLQVNRVVMQISLRKLLQHSLVSGPPDKVDIFPSLTALGMLLQSDAVLLLMAASEPSSFIPLPARPSVRRVWRAVRPRLFRWRELRRCSCRQSS